MDVKQLFPMLAALIAGTTLSLSACNTNKPADETVGALEAESASASATVSAIDYNTRIVTLAWQDGRVSSYKVGPEARNFNNIQVGDVVRASVSEAAVVWVGPSGGAPPSVGVDRVVVRSKAGERPGMMIADTAVISATVLRVDSVNRQITVRGPAGNERVLGVSPRVNLADITVGNLLSLSVTESVALWVEKP
jgi:Cu/Ag efflux protein CusF